MEQDIAEEFRRQRELLEATYTSVEKTRRYIFWMLVSVVVTFVLPLVGLLFAIPKFISTYQQMLTL